jgi:hypothetical protein
MSNLNIDMSTISVTCEGSKAPFDLLMNFCILGISLSIIVTGYQYVWQVTLPTLNQAVFDHILANENFKMDRTLMKMMLSSVALSLDPFQMFTRYLMTLSTLGKFVENNGMHAITEGCDTVSGGLDSILGYSTSMVAWCIYMPLIYLFANSVVPNYLPIPKHKESMKERLRREKIEKINPFEQKKQKDKNKMKEKEKQQSKVQQETVDPPSDDDNPNEGDADYAVKRMMTKHKEAMEKKEHHKPTHRERIKVYGNWLSEYVIFFVSVDLILAHYARRWVRFVAQAHNIVLNENKMNAVFNHSRDAKLITEKENRVKRLMDRFSFLNRQKREKALEDYLLREKVNSVQLKHAWEKDSIHRMPTYWELCCLVRDELLEKTIMKYLGRRVVSAISILGFVHMFTSVGRGYWYLAMRKIYLFTSVCAGFWNDEAYEAFRIKEITDSVNPDKENVEDTYIKVMAITVATRVSIFQIIGLLSIFSIVCTAVASSPLFVTSQRLARCIPPLIIRHPYKEALRREIKLVLQKDTDAAHVSEHVNRWVLNLKAFSIFLGESRLLGFINNMLIVSLTLATISYQPGTEFVILGILVLLLPFFFSKLSIVVILIGKTLKVTDSDLYKCFGIFSEQSRQAIVVDDYIAKREEWSEDSLSLEGGDHFEESEIRDADHTNFRYAVNGSGDVVGPRNSFIKRFQSFFGLRQSNRVAPIVVVNERRKKKKVLTTLDLDINKLIDVYNTSEISDQSNSLLFQSICDDLEKDSDLDEEDLDVLGRSIISKINDANSSDQSFFEADIYGIYESDGEESPHSDYSMTYVSEVLNDDPALVDYLDNLLFLQGKGPYSIKRLEENVSDDGSSSSKNEDSRSLNSIEYDEIGSWLEDALSKSKNKRARRETRLLSFSDLYGDVDIDNIPLNSEESKSSNLNAEHALLNDDDGDDGASSSITITEGDDEFYQLSDPNSLDEDMENQSERISDLFDDPNEIEAIPDVLNNRFEEGQATTTFVSEMPVQTDAVHNLQIHVEAAATIISEMLMQATVAHDLQLPTDAVVAYDFETPGHAAEEHDPLMDYLHTPLNTAAFDAMDNWAFDQFFRTEEQSQVIDVEAPSIIETIVPVTSEIRVESRARDRVHRSSSRRRRERKKDRTAASPKSTSSTGPRLSFAL